MSFQPIDGATVIYYSFPNLLFQDLESKGKETNEKIANIFQAILEGASLERGVQKTFTHSLKVAKLYCKQNFEKIDDEAVKTVLLSAPITAWNIGKREFLVELLDAGAPCGIQILNKMMKENFLEGIRCIAKRHLYDAAAPSAIPELASLFLFSCRLFAPRSDHPSIDWEEQNDWVRTFFRKIVSSTNQLFDKFSPIFEGLKIAPGRVKPLILDAIECIAKFRIESNYDGDTLLHYLSRQASIDIAEVLFKAIPVLEVVIFAKNKRGKIPFYVLGEDSVAKDEDALRLFFKMFPTKESFQKIMPLPSDILHHFARRGLKEVIKNMWLWLPEEERKRLLSAKDHNEQTPLMAICSFEKFTQGVREDFVKLFLPYLSEKELAIEDKNGNGVLEHAIHGGLNSVIKEILDKMSGRLDSQNFAGDTPLMIACQKEEIAIARLLLPHAEMLIGNKRNETILNIFESSPRIDKEWLELKESVYERFLQVLSWSDDIPDDIDLEPLLKYIERGEAKIDGDLHNELISTAENSGALGEKLLSLLKEERVVKRSKVSGD